MNHFSVKRVHFFKSASSLRLSKNNKFQHQYILLTIGNYDGVHIGHKFVIEQAINTAKKENLIPSVILFEPQTHEFFADELNRNRQIRIMSLQEKLMILKILGIKQVLIVGFNKKVSSISAYEFIEILVSNFGLKHLIIGDDFRLGQKKEGSPEMIQKLADKWKFTFTHIPAVFSQNIRVSSTNIRYLLENQDLDKANSYMYLPFYILGKVIEGDKIGRNIGFPTANIYIKKKITLKGVFSVSIVRQNKNNKHLLSGIANIGVRPTFENVSGNKNYKLEVHIFDFHENIYGEKITVFFHQKLRDEKKFTNKDDLIKQINKDIELSKYFSNKNHSTLLNKLKDTSPKELKED